MENIIRVKDYPGLTSKARAIVRETGINPVMAGYEMLVKGIVIVKVKKNTENLYNEIAMQSSVVPSFKPLTVKEEERHPVKQQILEGMRSAGIESDVKFFIKELAEEM